jgi:hypothetical protein
MRSYLTTADKAYVKDNYKRMLVRQMCHNMDVHETPVYNYMKEKGFATLAASLRQKLKKPLNKVQQECIIATHKTLGIEAVRECLGTAARLYNCSALFVSPYCCNAML